MQIVITPDGKGKCLYGEELHLHALGQLSIKRGSHVEPTDDGQWTADLSPVGGPMLGPFPNRSEALNAEREWLEQHWLDPTPLISQAVSQEENPHALAAEENHGPTESLTGRQCGD